MMDLVRRVNSTYSQVNRNIEILEWEGIVETKKLGRMRMIQLKQDDPKTRAILKALQTLKHQEVFILSPQQKKQISSVKPKNNLLGSIGNLYTRNIDHSSPYSCFHAY